MADLLEKLKSVYKNFQQVLNDVRKDKALENFEQDFSQVLDDLQNVIEVLPHFLNKCQEMNAEIIIHRKKSLEFEQKKHENEKERKALRKDMIRMCKCIGTFEENEMKYKELILKLESQITTFEKEKDISTSEKEKAFQIEAERERNLLLSRISNLESDLKAKEANEEEIKAKLLETVEAMQKLEESTDELKLKLKQELGRSQKVIKDRFFVEQEIKTKETKTKELEETITALRKKIEEMESKINAYKARITAHQTKICSLQILYKKCKESINQQVEKSKLVALENDKLALLLKKKDEDLKSLNEKLVNVINEKESSLQMFIRVQNQKHDSDDKHESLRSELTNAEREIFKLKKLQDKNQAVISSLEREKHLLSSNIVKQDALIKTYSEKYKSIEKEKNVLHNELKTLLLRIDKQHRLVSSLEEMKIQLLADIKNLTKKTEKLNNEICCHEDKEISMKSEILELSNKVALQKEMCCAAVTDRKMYCQQYKEMKEDRDQLKQKIDILDNYVNEMKEKIHNRSQDLENWKSKSDKLEFQNKRLLAKLTKEEEDYSTLKKEHEHIDLQHQVDLRIISEKDKAVADLKSKVNHITEDNMMLRSQVQQLNRNISNFENQLRLSEMAVKKEQESYKNLENSTKLLHLEIIRLTGEKQSLLTHISDLEKLKQSYAYAKQELDKERFKNATLEKQMQNPRNIHRWRLLKVMFDENGFR